MALVVTCGACGSEQEIYEAPDRSQCIVCGASLADSPSRAATPAAAPPTPAPAPAKPAAVPTAASGIQVGVRRETGSAPGQVIELTEEGEAFVEEAPEGPKTIFEDIEDIEGAREVLRWTLPLVPIIGLWRVWASPSRSLAERLLVTPLALASSAALVFGFWWFLIRIPPPPPNHEAQVADEIAHLQIFVEGYRQRFDRYPTAEDWQERVGSDQRLVDPWGRPYRYELEDRSYSLGTYGADGERGGNATARDFLVMTDITPTDAAIARRSASAWSAILRCPSCCPALQIGGAATMRTTARVEVRSDCKQAPGALMLFGESSLTAAGLSVGGIVKIFGPGRVLPEATPLEEEITVELPEMPAVTGCDHRDYEAPPGANRITPGIYCGGLRAEGAGLLTFAPGTYVISGGPLEIRGPRQVQADGVTFYITREVSTGRWGSALLEPDEEPRISAPTDGPLAGVLLLQHPDNPNAISIGGAFTSGLDGKILAPRAPLTIHGTKKRLRIATYVDSAVIRADVEFGIPETVSGAPPR